MDDIQIIDNTEQAKKNYGYPYGAIEIELTNEMINNLLIGKCIAGDSGEYSIFLTVGGK